MNPYLANLEQFGIKSELYEEGIRSNYFVLNKKGEVYFIKSLSIRFAIIDLTNIDAKNWVKSIIK